jgi:hypothetical protein
VAIVSDLAPKGRWQRRCQIGTLKLCDDSYDISSGAAFSFEPHFRSFGLDFRSVFDRQCVISPWA